MTRDEAQKTVDAKLLEVKCAVESLEKLFVEVLLKDEFSARTSQLIKKIENVDTERKALQRNLEESKDVLEAKAATLRRESQELLARANRPGSKKKLEEAEQVEGQGQAILQKISNLDNREEVIATEITKIAKEVFEEGFPLIRDNLPVLRETMSRFETGLKQGLKSYMRHTCTEPTGRVVWDDGLIRRPHWEALGL